MMNEKTDIQQRVWKTIEEKLASVRFFNLVEYMILERVDPDWSPNSVSKGFLEKELGDWVPDLKQIEEQYSTDSHSQGEDPWLSDERNMEYCISGLVEDQIFSQAIEHMWGLSFRNELSLFNAGYLVKEDDDKKTISVKYHMEMYRTIRQILSDLQTVLNPNLSEGSYIKMKYAIMEDPTEYIRSVYRIQKYFNSVHFCTKKSIPWNMASIRPETAEMFLNGSGKTIFSLVVDRESKNDLSEVEKGLRTRKKTPFNPRKSSYRLATYWNPLLLWQCKDRGEIRERLEAENLLVHIFGSDLYESKILNDRIRKAIQSIDKCVNQW